MAEPTSHQIRRDYNLLLVLLVVLGVVLVATTIRGPFSIDEANYLVTVTGLRSGTLYVPGTEGLTTSKELFYFDPEAFGRVASRTPVVSVAPPLYAPIALPFSYLGWRGLVLLNTVSYLLTALLVFTIVRRYAAGRQTPWIAALITLFGGYAVEYSQGLWPHMLSVFLVASAVYAASRVWNGERPRIAIICGLMIGLATGIREQNIVLAVLLGVTMLLFAGRKFVAACWYAFGAALPLAVIAAFHLFRQGLFHPFPKAVAFSGKLAQSLSSSSDSSPLQMFWARVVDFSAYPPVTDSFQSLFYKKDFASGVLLVGGVVKKALIQSSPWVALVLVILVLAWLKREADSRNVQKNLRALSLLVLPVLAILSFAGGGRTDGLCYNQRYFLELIPLMAIALALTLDESASSLTQWIAGLTASGALFALTLMLPSRALYQMALLRIPLVLALLLIAAWFVRSKGYGRLILPFLMGLCIGWGMFVHLFDDLSASRTRRGKNAAQLAVLESAIPDHSALFAYWGSKDVAAPLQLTRDVVILDVGADEGADAVRLSHELRLQNRRLFILTDVFPDTVLEAIAGEDSLAVVSRNLIGIDEVVERHWKESDGPGLPKL
jgi:hypothetical protein